MMTSDWILLGILVVLWVPLAVLTRRKSPFPLIPVFPLLLLIGGLLLNRKGEWLGTIAVGVFELVAVLLALIGHLREAFSSGKSE
jgi:hypothetical protein